MEALSAWLLLLLNTGSGLCSYTNFVRHFDVGPLKDEGDAEMFLRTDHHDGLDCVYPTDCADVQQCGRTKSGVYRVFPYGIGSGFLAACEMTTDGGGWLVIQHRHDGAVDFYRNWENYTNGFGNLAGEFWLGLEKIHLLTSQRKYELFVSIGGYEKGTSYARYNHFFISSQETKYRLLVQGYSGAAGDSLDYHNGQYFSTYDMDNDNSSNTNCAEVRRGAWWYTSCVISNLNGNYFSANQITGISSESMSWYHWQDAFVPLQTAEMKIRPRRND